MTVSSTKNSVTHNCNGVTTDFPFDFKVFKNEDLKVYIVDDNLTLLTPDIDYAVYDLNQDSGGHIVLNIAPSSNQKISIHRILLPVQETSFPNQGAFFPKVHESAFDQVVMLIQQLINTVGSTDGGESRALLLGPADENGQGAYRANGNRISNLGEPKNDTDAARIGDIKQFSDAAETAAEAAENASQAAITASDEAKQAAQRAEDSANSIDVSTFYTKEETDARFVGYYDSVPAAKQLSEIIYVPANGLMYWNGAKYISVIRPSTELIGIPMPYPLATIPSGYAAMQGQAFDPLQYPILAERYPDHIIPDLRGEFVRGWDNGRGIDSGRDLLSNQEDALQNIVGQIIIGKGTEGVSGSGAFSASNSYVGNSTHGSAGLNGRCVIDFNPALVARTADETRSRNISYNYICLLG